MLQMLCNRCQNSVTSLYSKEFWNIKYLIILNWRYFILSTSKSRLLKKANFQDYQNVRQSIYKFSLSWWVFVGLSVPIGPKFNVGPHVTPRKVYEWSKFQKLYLKGLIFVKFWKCPKKILWNPQTFVCFCFILF